MGDCPPFKRVCQCRPENPLADLVPGVRQRREPMTKGNAIPVRLSMASIRAVSRLAGSSLPARSSDCSRPQIITFVTTQRVPERTRDTIASVSAGPSHREDSGNKSGNPTGNTTGSQSQTARPVGDIRWSKAVRADRPKLLSPCLLPERLINQDRRTRQGR